MGLGPETCTQARPDDPDGGPDDPGNFRMIQDLVRMIRLQQGASAWFGRQGWGFTPMIRGAVQMIWLSPDDPALRLDVWLQLSSREAFFSFLLSSLPRFPRERCSCSLALALLLDIREAPTIPMHAHGRSVK